MIVFAALLVPAGRIADRVAQAGVPARPARLRRRLVAVFLRRSVHHRAPVIELPLLRIRSFALADFAIAVFFAGFGAMPLSGILLLTGVWGYSALSAGMALALGPVGESPRLATRRAAA